MGHGKRKAGFLGFQAGEIAFIEDEMAALAAEYGLEVDADVAASVSQRKTAKKARRRKQQSTATPAGVRTAQAADAKPRARLLVLQTTNDKDEPEADDKAAIHALVSARLRNVLPENGTLQRCAVPGCSCGNGSRELAIDAHKTGELLHRAKCGKCQHGVLQHAVAIREDETGKPSGGQRLLSALFELVRLVRIAGSVLASREWTKTGMELLDALLEHMRRQFTAGGSHNGQKSTDELQHEKQLVGELQLLAKRARQVMGSSARDELMIELACLGDQMYFHCYYTCIVLYGRGCAAVPAPDEYFRQLAALTPESVEQLEAFLDREVTASRVLESLALPLAEPGKSTSDLKRAMNAVEEQYAQNPLLSILHSRVQEGVRLFYEQGIGLHGEMDAWLANPDAFLAATSAVKTKKKPQKKHYRRERHAAKATEAEAKDAISGPGKPLVEMPSFPLLAQWRNNCRDWCCHLFAYATPTVEALEVLASHAPLVEMGAGTGYWSGLLQQRGVDIVAYDKCPPTTETQSTSSGAGRAKRKEQNAYHGQVPPFCPLGTGGPEVLKQPDMQSRSLFLCYPPPNDEMALNCVRFFQGDHVLHVGEWQGDTGERRFEKELESRFVLEREVVLPNWGNSAYHLTVWRRKASKNAKEVKTKLLACFSCGQSVQDVADNGDYEAEPLRRCVLCKTNVYCSVVCAERDRKAHAAEHAKRLVFLEDEDALDFDNDAHYRPLVDVTTLDTSALDAVVQHKSNWNALVKQASEGSDQEEDDDGDSDEEDEDEDEDKATPAPPRSTFAFNFSA